MPVAMRTPAKTYEGNECARCHKKRRYASTRGCVQCAKLAVYKKRGQTAPSSTFVEPVSAIRAAVNEMLFAELSIPLTATGNISTTRDEVVLLSPAAEAQLDDLFGDIE